MKKRIALVGLGNLSPKISPALNESSCVEVIAVCDINPNAIGRDMYKETPFYTDYRELKKLSPDYVYIATDPGTHYEIADYFIDNGIAVLSDKPPTKTLEEYSALLQKSTDNNVFYNVVYHFRYSREILWLKEHLKDFGSLVFASARYDDPYCESSVILPGREKLMGAWLDSASNILGVWSFLFPELIPQAVKTSFKKDSIHQLPIYAEAYFRWGNTPFSITISWMNNTRSKEMIFVFESDVVYIDLPNQEVYVNGELKLKNYDVQSTIVHYKNFFNNFNKFFDNNQDRSLTELLYEC